MLRPRGLQLHTPGRTRGETAGGPARGLLDHTTHNVTRDYLLTHIRSVLGRTHEAEEAGARDVEPSAVRGRASRCASVSAKFRADAVLMMERALLVTD